MNKLTKGLLTVSLAAAVFGAVACGGCDGSGSDAWKGTTFTDYGNVIAQTNGGFVAETDKYVYFINGVGSSSSDNTFGVPIKGALVAADKSDLSNSQVVIPELMVSSDYDAGVYLFKEEDGVYAYYGTPNREKNSSGNVAYSEMTFTKTRLDGKNSKKLKTVSSHSTTYRIAQGANGIVYIVYYDTDDSAIVSYDTKNDMKKIIAKTDAKTNEKTDNGEYLSLGEYKFLKNGNAAQVVYTLTAYTQEYFSSQEEQEDSYTRQTATYNYMYLYTAGEEAVCIGDGKTNVDTTYALKSCVGEYLFYTETKLGGSAKTYGCKISNTNGATEINYPDNVKDDMIIKSLEEIYYYDSDAKQVVKNTLVKEPLTEYYAKTPILKDETVSTLLAVGDDYAYCFNSDGYIVAIDLAENGKTIRISERTASTSWYKPETVVINGTEYMLYCDNSSEGNSYIYRANLNDLSSPKEQDTDDDGETDVYYLESSFIGVMPAADRAAVVSAKINAIEATLELKEGEDGKYYAESVLKARAAYDNLDKDAKNNILEADVKKLENAEKALPLADAFKKLESVRDYVNLSQDKKDALKADYEEAKALVESYGDDCSLIRAYLTDNLNYFYQETGAKLNAADSEQE